MKKEYVNIWKDTKGSAYIYGVVIILICSMLLSCLFLLFSARTTLREIRQGIKEELDAFVGTMLPEIYPELKTGSGFAQRLDREKILSDAMQAIGFASPDEVHRETRGMIYVETRIKDLSFDDENGSGLSLTVRLSCTVSMLIFSRQIYVGTGQYAISSRYILKGA
ncbi:MAG: hypothetical protein IJT60_02200 [Clostridia bacterium]|nr:hypothetical protein [Clostridia bacterium]